MDYVSVVIDQEVARITLDAPPGNRINFQMREELGQAVDRVAAGTARALLVTGAGEDFCLGGDARQWVDVPVEKLRPKIAVFAEALHKLEQLRIPTIAVVQGTCAGGGFELALSCDLILAGESARFVFPEAFLGIMTLQGGIVQLAERVGRARAIELVMTGEPQPARRLADWNIVTNVVPDPELDAEAAAWADRLGHGPTATYAATKDLLEIWRSEAAMRHGPACTTSPCRCSSGRTYRQPSAQPPSPWTQASRSPRPRGRIGRPRRAEPLPSSTAAPWCLLTAPGETGRGCSIAGVAGPVRAPACVPRGPAL
ncbi:enoyl-CoA hydratase/isomerase family protein [Streptomyces sp. NPDC050743]|uniref:enoyl-CoA hydratase/isomerase family protein n=1 Tax=Streptomyces sp. NPDC050743 TaxID=3365634 RepID=UPI0037B4531D